METTKQRFKRVQVKLDILHNGRVDVILQPNNGNKIRSQSVIISNGSMIIPQHVRKNNEGQEAWRFGARKGEEYKILVFGALDNNLLFCAYKKFTK